MGLHWGMMNKFRQAMRARIACGTRSEGGAAEAAAAVAVSAGSDGGGARIAHMRIAWRAVIVFLSFAVREVLVSGELCSVGP